mgnify:CR=1 FL=1
MGECRFRMHSLAGDGSYTERLLASGGFFAK